MKRRDFLKSAATASLVLSTPLAFSRSARAQSAGDLLLVMIDAQGGWDPTVAMDPKGAAPFDTILRPGDIRTAGAIRYAPMTFNGATPVDYMAGPAGSQTPFFERYQNELLILNGVDTQTNSHDVGPRFIWGGNARTGTPTIGALLAAVREDAIGHTLPLGLVSTGGYDFPAGLIPVARAANADRLKEATLPNRVLPLDPNSTELFQHPEVRAAIEEAKLARRDRVRLDDLLPGVRKTMEAYWSVRDARESFSRLQTGLANLSASAPLSEAESDIRVLKAAQIAIAGMSEGICQSTMLSTPGFDTHSNHDAKQPARMQEVLSTVDYCVRALQAMGLYERTIIMVGADFGRTIFNDEDPAKASRGKDHWPITSLMFLGGPISGGRVLGASDLGPLETGAAANLKGHRALPVKVEAGQLVTTAFDDVDGINLTPAAIHQSLRTVLGLEGHPIADRFEVPDRLPSPLPIFS